VSDAGRIDDVAVSTEWLAARLNRPDVCVVDVRGKVLPPGSKPRYVARRADYNVAHLPGAVFVDWTRDIVDLGDPVPVQVASAEAFAAKMGEIGIGDGMLVVAYDDYDHIFAGRLVWALRYYGHDAARVLDGGWARWVAEGRPTTADVPQPLPALFTAKARPSLRRTADEVMAALGQPDALIVDARPADQYAGTVTAAGRGGRIPGARNVPYASLIDPETSKFRSPGELREAFAAGGVDVEHLPPNVIVYCNGGVSCTVAMNALRILGRDDAAVYDGSWNEWGNDASRPVETGRGS
jgi:thiosulfate/3-mercaptopyruvate sulfurtransferase